MRFGVIGAGALGSEVTLRMAEDYTLLPPDSAVLIVDPDRLEAENVSLSRIYGAALRDRGPAVLGSSKAEVLASSLNRWNSVSSSPCVWRAFPVEIADLSWHHLRSLDLLISCTDNAMARLETTLAARCLGLPILDGGVMGEGAEGGRVTCFTPHPDAACYLCGLGEQRRGELLTLASAVSLPCTAPAEAAMGSNPLLSPPLQQTAGLLLEELRRFVHETRFLRRDLENPGSWALRLEPGKGSVWGRERIRLRRSVSCPWHAGMRLPLVSVDPDETFREALADRRLGSASRLQFPWPVCLLAVCRHCGAREERPRRVAWVRQRGVCARCETPHQLEPLRALASVGQNDTVAQMTPRQLGWADRQVLQLRPSLVPARNLGEER